MLPEFESIHWTGRVGLIVLIALLSHVAIRLLETLSIWIISPASAASGKTREIFTRRHPKVATITGLVTSALTFVIYFSAFGLILRQFNVSLTAYFATASVIGLAVAFGTQGLVQDVVSGITLIFTDAFDIGDTVEMSGQIGKVEKVGLRFTTLTNIVQQKVYIPNRMISVLGRYKQGHVRAYADVQIPKEAADTEVMKQVQDIANAVYEQHKALMTGVPEAFGIYEAPGGLWKYVRIRFRIWPGQNALIETGFKQRILAAMKAVDPAYQDWMITVAYRTA